MLSLINSDNRGTAEDKLRLFLIYFLSTKTIPPAEMEQFEEALTKAGADLTPLKLLKKYFVSPFLIATNFISVTEQKPSMMGC